MLSHHEGKPPHVSQTHRSAGGGEYHSNFTSKCATLFSHISYFSTNSLQNYKNLSNFASKLKVKVKKLRYFLTKYPLSCLLIMAIWVVCLIPIPETPLSEVRLIDKWTHVVMYLVLSSLLWIEYLRAHVRVVKSRVVLGATLAPLLMGGLVEIVQATCTNGVRNGDWIDFLADAVGVAVGQIIGIVLARCLSKL